MEHHPVHDLLEQVASGHIPTLRELERLRLPSGGRKALDDALLELEGEESAKPADLAAEIIRSLPARFQDADYLDHALTPAELAEGLPAC